MGSKRIRVSRDRKDPQKDPFSTSRSSPETTCSHPGCFYGMCMCCGELLEEDYDELEDELAGRNVTRVLKTLRMEVLGGCKIVFSHISPPANYQHLWKMAKQLGATCTVDLDDSVTHVVAMHAGSKKTHWAVKEKKFLVDPRWIEASFYFWKRQPEESFPVSQEKKPEVRI